MDRPKRGAAAFDLGLKPEASTAEAQLSEREPPLEGCSLSVTDPMTRRVTAAAVLRCASTANATAAGRRGPRRRVRCERRRSFERV